MWILPHVNLFPVDGNKESISAIVKTAPRSPRCQIKTAPRSPNKDPLLLKGSSIDRFHGIEIHVEEKWWINKSNELVCLSVCLSVSVCVCLNSRLRSREFFDRVPSISVSELSASPQAQNWLRLRLRIGSCSFKSFGSANATDSAHAHSVL
jgi:hypothetical protein